LINNINLLFFMISEFTKQYNLIGHHYIEQTFSNKCKYILEEKNKGEL